MRRCCSAFDTVRWRAWCELLMRNSCGQCRQIASPAVQPNNKNPAGRVSGGVVGTVSVY
jgi:hypothetical protein